MNILTVDIGGTFIKYAKMDTNMNILSKGKVKTPKEGREKFVEVIGEIYDTMKDVEGIAISTCGIIDCENGYYIMGGGQMVVNNGFHFRDELYKRCPVKIYIENDAKCAAMAEAKFGSLADVNDGFVLLFGTMIGGGYIKDKKVVHGKHFSAGEVSYLFSADRQYPTFDNVWGNKCGVPNLCKMYADKKRLKVEEVDGEILFAAVAKQDKDAIDVLDIYTRNIAVEIFNIQTTLDPDRFAIGGGISEQPVFIEYIKKHLDDLYKNCVVELPRAEVVQCKYKNDANLIGAIACFMANCM